MHLNICWRLTLWNTLTLAVVLTCLAALVYGLFGHALYEQSGLRTPRVLGLPSQADDRMEAATEQSGSTIGLRSSRDRQNLFCVTYRADGALYARTAGMAEETAPADAAGRSRLLGVRRAARRP